MNTEEHIDGAVCYFDVGSSYPGGAEATKGGGVHPLKDVQEFFEVFGN